MQKRRGGIDVTVVRGEGRWMFCYVEKRTCGMCVFGTLLKLSR
jgi:hypothetical protein